MKNSKVVVACKIFENELKAMYCRKIQRLRSFGLRLRCTATCTIWKRG
jgi:hypothetical protein